MKFVPLRLNAADPEGAARELAHGLIDPLRALVEHMAPADRPQFWFSLMCGFNSMAVASLGIKEGVKVAQDVAEAMAEVSKEPDWSDTVPGGF